MKVENSKTKSVRRIGILVVITIILVPSFYSLTKNIIESAKSKASSDLAFEKIEIKFENIYTKELENEISQFIHAQIQQLNLLTFDQNKFYKLLKTNFNIIKQFECHIDSLTLNIKIVGVSPFCTINNNWVLGNKKNLFPMDLFDQATLANLKNISLKDISDDEKTSKNPISKDLYHSIKQIPPEYWQNFDINFIKFTEIYLTPKNQALNYCLLTKISRTKIKTTKLNSIFDEQKLNKAQALYNKLMHNENFIKKMKTKKNHKLVLDLRFKNRIVVSFEAAKLENKDKEGGR